MGAVGPPDKLLSLRQEGSQTKPEGVFHASPGRDPFGSLIDSVVRRHIALQHPGMTNDHPVLRQEAVLTQRAVEKVTQHLSATEGEWGIVPFRLRKIAVVRHLRELAKLRMDDYVEKDDLDDEIAEQALKAISVLDFEDVFPSSWING